MGCGLVSQRGAGAAGGASSPSATDSSGSSVGERHGRGNRHGQNRDQDLPDRDRSGNDDDEAAEGSNRREGAEERAGRSRGRHGEDGHRGNRVPGRRLIVGERIVLTSRVQGQNASDHAFCFECGACFQLGSARAPQCARCGSTFVQYLRAAGAENWISAESATAQGYAFDDQLDNSITASLDATPMTKKPTQCAFLRELPSIQINEEEVETRSKLEAADPRKSCSICRDVFAVEDLLRKCPCGHEFHDGCIVPWLQSNNTCPICRWKMPEASESEGEDEDGEEVVGVGRKKRRQRPSNRPAANQTADVEASALAAEENAPREIVERQGAGGEEAAAFLEGAIDAVESEGLAAISPPLAGSSETVGTSSAVAA